MVDTKQAPEIEILKARRAMEAALTDLGAKALEAERMEIDATRGRQRADEARREYEKAVVVHRRATRDYQLQVLGAVRVDGPKRQRQVIPIEDVIKEAMNSASRSKEDDGGLQYCDGDPAMGDPCTNPECPPGYHGVDPDES